MESDAGVLSGTGEVGPYDEVNVYLMENDNNNNSLEDYDSFGNGTNNTVVLHALGYSTLHIVISSIVLTFMMIVVVIGNMLVIIAIATEKSLKNLQNWFIASLAVADFFVGLLIMPFSLANELMGYWIFGSVWCSIHSAMDVLLCTSSIMNICLISLDRYWSITQAVDYLKKRTPARAAVMIGMVWVLSALISIPPLLGWRDPDAMTNSHVPTCQLSREIGYVLYSALGSFYIPSCIMVFVYIRIYFAARARARRAVCKRPKPKPAAIEIEERHSTNTTVPQTPTVKAASSTSMIPTPLMIDTSIVSLRSSPPDICPTTTTTKIPSLPPTPDGRSVKQVGFQEPLETNEVVVRPEIMVEHCSPEDTNMQGGGEKDGNNDDSDSSKDEAQVKKISNTTTDETNNDRTLECMPSASTDSVGVVTYVIIKEIKQEADENVIAGSVSSSCSSPNKNDARIHPKGNTDEISGEQKKPTSCPPNNGGSGGCGDKELAEVDFADPLGEEKESRVVQPLVPTIHLKRGSEAHPVIDHVSPHQSPLAVSELESAISELQSNGGSRADEGSTPPVVNPSSKRSKRTKLHFLRVETPTIWRTSSSLSLNGDVHILGTLSRSCSRLQLDMDPVSDVEPSSSDSGAVTRCAVVKPLKLRLCQPFFGKKSSSASNKARRDVLDMGKLPSPKDVRDPEREKRRIARKKEKRATLILGLIMGSFILCWLPFFFLYILEPLCPSCQVAPWGFAIAFWLGYMNSALNPVIYTIFNKDFRRAFRRILFK